MADQPRTVAVTGANGYIGSVLTRAFAAAGWRVVALQRRAPADGRFEFVPYTLSDGPRERLDVDALVHCAYDLRARDAADIERANVGGTRTLLAATEHVPNVVLISSMSAYAGTTQVYGQAKLHCEDLVAERGGTALRLGLVYGAQSGGMVGSLRKLAALPLVPVLRPDSHQFTVHAADMADCVLATAKQPPQHRVLGVANSRAVPFTEIMRRLHAVGSTRAFRSVAIPSSWMHAALRAAEAVGLRAGFRADSLLGLTRPARDVPHVQHWAEQGIVLRDFADGLVRT